MDMGVDRGPGPFRLAVRPHKHATSCYAVTTNVPRRRPDLPHYSDLRVALGPGVDIWVRWGCWSTLQDSHSEVPLHRWSGQRRELQDSTLFCRILSLRRNGYLPAFFRMR